MQNFDIDAIDSLSEEQVRYLLRSELERNKLLVKRNHFTLFRYEVAQDTMVILDEAPSGEIIHSSFENYKEEIPNLLLDHNEHARLIKYLALVAFDPDFPKEGSLDFTLIDGAQISAEYSCLYNADLQVSTIIGQMVNIYQTHDRMVSTIKMLNEQVEINDALRQAYETIVMINLNDYSFQLIKGTPEVMIASGKCQSVLDLAKLFCQYYIELDYQPGFLEFVDNLTLGDRLLSDRFIVYEYKTRNIGWCRARIVPGKSDSRGHLESVMFTTERSSNQQGELSMLRVVATTDALTGIMNRFAGEQAINAKLERQEAGIYLLFDCDYFKTINDQLGHPVGDRVLIEIARALKEVYQEEIVLRLGGDEFVVYISSRQLVSLALFSGVREVVEPLYYRLKQISIPALKQRTPKLSGGAVFISAGVPHNLSEIYELADKKLYVAKATHNGQLVSVKI